MAGAGGVEVGHPIEDAAPSDEHDALRGDVKRVARQNRRGGGKAGRDVGEAHVESVASGGLVGALDFQQFPRWAEKRGLRAEQKELVGGELFALESRKEGGYAAVLKVEVG